MREPEHTTVERRQVAIIMVAAVVGFAILFPMSRANYLLFHAFVEMITVSIALGGFVLAWNTRAYAGNDYALKLGIGLLFVALTTLLHALAYKGMGVFPGAGANLPTQLWIISRGLLAATFLVAGVSLYRSVPTIAVWTPFAGMTTLALVSVSVWPVFPTMYIDGKGLTPLKIAVEYMIVGVMLLGAALLWRARKQFGGHLARILLAGIAAMIAAELAFTLYIDVYGFFNLLGHLLTFAGFTLLYVAIIDTGVRLPTALLFHDLESRERSERAASASLERANLQLRVMVADLRATNHMLDEATHAKDEFLRNMSHELRTPLNSIIGFSEVLRQGMTGPLNDEQKRQLEMIHTAGNHLLRLVEELLDLSRVESGTLHLVTKDFDATQIAQAAVEMVRPLPEQKSLHIECHAPDGAIVVKSDPVRVEQILLNLLGNAIKYTDLGHVDLSVSIADESILFEVSDTGSGIAPEQLDSCFDAFYRVGDVAVEGSGLGLPVSKHLAELLGGDIEASSMLGAGSTFLLKLPLTLEIAS